jgi:hypothetical protein
MFNSVTTANVLATNNPIWNYNTTTGIDPSYSPNTNPYPYTYTTTTTSPSTIIPTTKRCRDCNHAHLNDQCVEFSDWGAVTFVNCQCKEYTPKDNLEYLEHLYDKKERSKDPSAF